MSTRCQPAVPRDHRRRSPRVSVILVDWGARESFHSLHYLNRQTADREDYELIWVEFYDRRPEGLRRLAAGLDKWVVLGYPDDTIYHKHRLYNVGLLVAAGEVCVICDSDAIFRPTFIASLIRAFAETPRAVIHLDEVRNASPRFYPFNYPSIEEILGPGCINWCGTTTLGLNDSPDMLHHANYGACMAARRKDLLAVGGADEHLDYLGYICGPYDLTFRLINAGRAERWLRDEHLYHTWHPGQHGFNTDYQGPHDGMCMASLAMEARATRRVRPCVRNPWVARTWWGRLRTEELLRRVGERPEPAWRAGAQPPRGAGRAYWMERDYHGFDVFHHGDTWYAVRAGGGPLDLEKVRGGGYRELWQAPTQRELNERLPLDRGRREERADGASAPVRLWRKVRAQPLHRLPLRVARRACRLVSDASQKRHGPTLLRSVANLAARRQ
jgi:hypothetical protein